MVVARVAKAQMLGAQPRGPSEPMTGENEVNSVYKLMERKELYIRN